MAVTLEAQSSSSGTRRERTNSSRRIQERRVSVSPFLCNTLWGWQSAEGFNPQPLPGATAGAGVGIPRIDVAHHMNARRSRGHPRSSPGAGCAG